MNFKEVDWSNAAFKHWFGDSKVVDANGQPLVVYHGTDERFSEFAGDSFYFTQDEGIAGTYGKNIMSVYLSIKNPLDLRDMERAEAVVREVVPDGLEDDQRLSETSLIMAVQYGQDEFKKWAQDRGYDGLIMPTTQSVNEIFNMAEVPAYVAFQPEQIKIDIA